MGKFVIKKLVEVQETVELSQFIAHKIRYHRERNGITQDDLAKKLRLSRTSMVNIEHGRQALSIDKLHALCEFFNIKSNEILPF